MSLISQPIDDDDISCIRIVDYDCFNSNDFFSFCFGLDSKWFCLELMVFPLLQNKVASARILYARYQLIQISIK